MALEPSSVNNQAQQINFQEVSRVRHSTEQRPNQAEDPGKEVSRTSSKETSKSGEQTDKEKLTVSELDTGQLEEIKDSINKALNPINIGLDFEENEKTEKLVVKVINKETEEVIRQIPPEAMLQMAKRMEDLTGILVDTWR